MRTILLSARATYRGRVVGAGFMTVIILLVAHHHWTGIDAANDCGVCRRLLLYFDAYCIC